MKKIIVFGSLIAMSFGGFAQSEKYVNAMKAGIAALDSSFKSPQNMFDLANKFERIAQAEKNQWLAYYYAAFCQVNYSYLEQDKTKTDAIADKATSLLDKADSLQPKNSEISCVRSMIANAHMMVNPMQRYMQYGAESASQLEKAMMEDPTNPRPYFLKGQGLKYTPEQFGGGCKTATPILETALEKYGAFKPASDISPNWGMKRVQALLEECK